MTLRLTYGFFFSLPTPHPSLVYPSSMLQFSHISLTPNLYSHPVLHDQSFIYHSLWISSFALLRSISDLGYQYQILGLPEPIIHLSLDFSISLNGPLFIQWFMTKSRTKDEDFLFLPFSCIFHTYTTKLSLPPSKSQSHLSFASPLI